MTRRTRTIQTDKGTADLTYERTPGDRTWFVEVTPDNSDRPRDRFTTNAFRDEAGFAGRDWRVQNRDGSTSLPGFSDQFASLREVAQTAIAVAFDHVETEILKDTVLASQQAEAIAGDVLVIYSDDGGPGADAPWIAFKAPTPTASPDSASREAGVQALDPTLWGVWGRNPETGDTYLNSTHDTSEQAVDTALALVREPLPTPGEPVTYLSVDTSPDGGSGLGATPDSAPEEAIVNHPNTTAQRDLIAERIAVEAKADTSWSAEYAERGILRDTFACAFTGTRALVRDLAFDLLASGVEVKIARDATNADRWHLAVRGGAAGTPLVWIVSVRGEPEGTVRCSGTPADGGQHPLTEA